ncbi:hypothetical protein BCR44DRAFT_1052528 [Catenaria anguillulae PL171]|uniref:Uncharacterized protein n=1 Tax=Catenaria anguillulae PL171 TaxID=765915 RepID=A0A1Y2HRD1_9FUNG|nr:hypothetical protein BCR44DRAFT_1052528 [Catenaria anguillulae PL171]
MSTNVGNNQRASHQPYEQPVKNLPSNDLARLLGSGLTSSSTAISSPPIERYSSGGSVVAGQFPRCVAPLHSSVRQLLHCPFGGAASSLVVFESHSSAFILVPRMCLVSRCPNACCLGTAGQIAPSPCTAAQRFPSRVAHWLSISPILLPWPGLMLDCLYLSNIPFAFCFPIATHHFAGHC